MTLGVSLPVQSRAGGLSTSPWFRSLGDVTVASYGLQSRSGLGAGAVAQATRCRHEVDLFHVSITLQRVPICMSKNTLYPTDSLELATEVVTYLVTLAGSG